MPPSTPTAPHINTKLVYTKEDIGRKQQLYEILRGKNFALDCLS